MMINDLIVFLCSMLIVVVMTFLICLDAICVPIYVYLICNLTYFVLFLDFITRFKALTILVNCVSNFYSLYFN